MAAVTRWTQYDISTSGVAALGSNDGMGTRGYSIGLADPIPGEALGITIGPTTNVLYLAVDNILDSRYITLASGTDLDPRFIAKDITEKLHALNAGTTGWDNAICLWENATVTGSISKSNRFKIYSGTLGSASSVYVAASGTHSAHEVLGFATKREVGGSEEPDGKGTAYTFDGTMSVSGTYYGFFDEVYKIVISDDSAGYERGIGDPSKGGGNTYAGTISTTGAFNYAGNLLYTLNIDATNGTTMGGGTGNVPTMTWTSTGGADNSSNETELLYPDYWYNVGKYGLAVKFTDAVFNTCSGAWTIQCYQPLKAGGGDDEAFVGTAEYVYASNRGDASSDPIQTISGGYTKLGSRGLWIKFNPDDPDTDKLGKRDCFYVICSGPKPYSYDISSLNYGNVTVSTESPVKCVMFEIKSGAAQMSTVKFGLQSHGTFSHHEAGNNDTYFRFATVGPANNPPASGIEWYPNVTADDINDPTPPAFMYANNANLPVVSTADDSESVGNYPLRGMTSDPMWVCIRLGASETGANSTINYRLYFDYA